MDVTWIFWTFFTIHVLGIISTIGQIDKPRKPISHAQAVFTVLLTPLAIYGDYLLWVN